MVDSSGDRTHRPLQFRLSTCFFNWPDMCYFKLSFVHISLDSCTASDANIGTITAREAKVMFSVCLSTGGGVPDVTLLGSNPKNLTKRFRQNFRNDQAGARVVRLLRSRRRTVLLLILLSF